MVLNQFVLSWNSIAYLGVMCFPLNSSNVSTILNYFSNDRPRCPVVHSTSQISFAVSSAYYGLSFNSNRLGGSKYLNATYTALVEICSYGAAQLMLRKCSSRQLFVFSTGMCGLCLFVAPLAKSGKI